MKAIDNTLENIAPGQVEKQIVEFDSRQQILEIVELLEIVVDSRYLRQQSYLVELRRVLNCINKER